MGVTQARRSAKPIGYDVDPQDDIYPARSHSSVRRYRQPVDQDTDRIEAIQKGTALQRRRAPGSAITTEDVHALTHPALRKKRGIPLLAIGLGMLAMALLAVGFNAFGSWWQIHQNDQMYGRPRTFQLDAVVGHNDSENNKTHLIFINLNRHVQIIEIPGGDASHARIYTGPILYGDGQDLTPITAEVKDVNGDGKPDLIVHIQDQRIIYINDGTQFRPLQVGEHINL